MMRDQLLCFMRRDGDGDRMAVYRYASRRTRYCEFQFAHAAVSSASTLKIFFLPTRVMDEPSQTYQPAVKYYTRHFIEVLTDKLYSFLAVVSSVS
jgi:hypothetical protein